MITVFPSTRKLKTACLWPKQCGEGNQSFFGLYAGKGEQKHWCWHHKDHQRYRYSTAFLFQKDENVLFLLSPERLSQEGGNPFFYKYDLRHEKLTHCTTMNKMGNLIHNCLTQKDRYAERATSITSLPSDIKCCLPSVLFDEQFYSTLNRILKTGKASVVCPLVGTRHSHCKMSTGCKYYGDTKVTPHNIYHRTWVCFCYTLNPNVLNLNTK